MITYGTHYFITRQSAIRYYRDYNFDADSVDEKIRLGEICIGTPPTQQGETMVLNKEEGRYFITRRGDRGA